MKGVFGGFIIVLSVPHGHAAVIDLFASLGEPVVRSRYDEEHEISGSLFDTRYLDHSGQSPETHTFVVTPDLGLLVFETPPSSRGYFELGYRSSEPVDLLAGGATALRFSFAGGEALPLVSSRASFPFRFVLETEAGLSRTPADSSLLPEVFNTSNGSFFVDFPFSEFSGGDLGAVTELRFEGYRISDNTRFQLDRIETVPEPAAPVLLLTASLPLVFRRRR